MNVLSLSINAMMLFIYFFTKICNSNHFSMDNLTRKRRSRRHLKKDEFIKNCHIAYFTAV